MFTKRAFKSHFNCSLVCSIACVDFRFLNENKIQVLTLPAFPYLPQLETLSLAGNVIRWIEPGVFASLPNLAEL